MKLARQYGPIFGSAASSPSSWSPGSIWWTSCATRSISKVAGGGSAHRPRRRRRRPVHVLDEEPNWRKAHNILLPNFGMQAIKGYMPMMVDIAMQLVEKWERLNPDEEIDVPADMTRLTLDTIGTVRLRLPVQLLLPRGTSSVRGQHDLALSKTRRRRLVCRSRTG